MNEIKRGFLKDYYKNGELKTFEEKDKEYVFLTIMVSCGLIFSSAIFICWVITFVGLD